MKIKLDLHVHSEYSYDGRMTPAEIAELGRAAGLSGAAVCDHDRTAPLPETEGFLLIPGTEVSTEQGHLLGLFVTEPVPGGDLARAVGAIRAQGGIAVLAHPFERSSDASRFDAAAGLVDGIEVMNSRAERKNPRANAMAAELAERFSLPVFAGSDAHVPQEVGNSYITVDVGELSLPAVREALVTGEREVCGRRSPALFTARSQLTKLRKKSAGAPAYIKWVLFAGKCLAQDIFSRR